MNRGESVIDPEGREYRIEEVSIQSSRVRLSLVDLHGVRPALMKDSSGYYPVSILTITKWNLRNENDSTSRPIR